MAGPGASPSGGDRLAGVISAARALLEERAREINDLNVFPVADGDTGTNMVLTVQAIEIAARGLTGTPAADRSEAIARAALLGARGNSGMILSQMMRGAADALADEPLLDGHALTRALRGASDTAYRAVRDPVEGTMLTVIRALAEGAEASGVGDLRGVMGAAIEAGRRSLVATQDMLPQLREAGVVDAGALGVLLIVEALASGLSGQAVGPAIPVTAPGPVKADHEPSTFRYCTSFVLDGAAIALDELEDRLAPLGDSLLVMGDRRQAKVHVHTDEPARAIRLAEAVGIVSGVSVDDMRRQEEARAARIARRSRTEQADSLAALDPATQLDAGRTALITDSAADLPLDARGANVMVAPVPVSFGTESFRDGVDLDAEEFYARLTTGAELPTTAAPSLGELAEIYGQALERFETAVVLHMNRKMSATVEVARRAALEVAPDRIAIIETESISLQLGLLVSRARAHIEAGTTLGAIGKLVDLFRRTQGTAFTMETLEFLRRGGRIGPAKALVGNLLGLRPVLEIVDGEIRPLRRVRGADRLPAMVEYLSAGSDAGRPLRVALAHARAEAAIPALAALVSDARPAAVVEIVTEIGPTVGTHAGPGAVAISFFHDPLDEGGST